MLELSFRESDWTAAVAELVPEYQRETILKLLPLGEDRAEDLEHAGVSLLGEKRTPGFVVPTGIANSGSAGVSLWACLESEVYELICGKSAAYKGERNASAETVKDLIKMSAGAVAAKFAMNYQLLLGAATLCLLIAVKMGRNAYCKWRKPIQDARASSR